MINFKQKDELVPSLINLVAILLMIIALPLIWIKPKPSTTITQSAARKLFIEISDAKKVSANVVQNVGPRVWQGDSDTVAASVLAILTRQTNANSLKLSAFRPQRPQDLDNLVELPYTAQVSGQYSGIRALIHALDSSDSKVALKSIQITSSGEATHEVTASITLSAYVPSDVIAQAIQDANAQNNQSASQDASQGGPHA